MNDAGAMGHPIHERYIYRLPAIRKVARECGYAIGIHGSGTRDLDLIAAPWIDDAKADVELVEAVRLAVDGIIVDYPGVEKNPAYRSHGRKAWSIQIGGGLYIDLSVMPLLPGPNREDPFFWDTAEAARAAKYKRRAFALARKLKRRRGEAARLRAALELATNDQETYDYRRGVAAGLEAAAAVICGLCRVNQKQPDEMAVGQTSVSKSYIPGGEPVWFWVHDVIYSNGACETVDCKAAAIRAIAADPIEGATNHGS